MPERIEVPPTMIGSTEEKLNQIWRYLYNTSEVQNRNFQSIGGNELTDKERTTMKGIMQETGEGQSAYSTLKQMVLDTAEYVKKEMKSVRDFSLTDEVTSGRFDRYVQQVNAKVPSDPAGHLITQQLITILQKLKQDDISLRNYIYAGKLRTVSGTDIYGVAIGKNVVTFAQDGTETFNPANAVMEVTAGGIQGNLTGNVTGNLTGQVLNATTTETDMDDVTAPGTYWLTMANMTHAPSDLSGIHEVQVTGNGTQINQRVYGNLSIYIRNYDGGSWNSWRKIEGTV